MRDIVSDTSRKELLTISRDRYGAREGSQEVTIWVLVAEMSLKNKWDLANKQGMEVNSRKGHNVCEGTRGSIGERWIFGEWWIIRHGWNEKSATVRASVLYVSIRPSLLWSASIDWEDSVWAVRLSIFVPTEALMISPSAHAPGHYQPRRMAELQLRSVVTSAHRAGKHVKRKQTPREPMSFHGNVITNGVLSLKIQIKFFPPSLIPIHPPHPTSSQRCILSMHPNFSFVFLNTLWL